MHTRLGSMMPDFLAGMSLYAGMVYKRCKLQGNASCRAHLHPQRQAQQQHPPHSHCAAMSCPPATVTWMAHRCWAGARAPETACCRCSQVAPWLPLFKAPAVPLTVCGGLNVTARTRASAPLVEIAASWAATVKCVAQACAAGWWVRSTEAVGSTACLIRAGNTGATSAGHVTEILMICKRLGRWRGPPR